MELVNSENPTISEPSQNNRPKPTDFDIFLPWACRELSINVDIVVIRASQTTYVSALNKKATQKQKSTKSPFVAKIEVGSDEDVHSSMIDKAPSISSDIVKIESVYDSNNNLVQLKFLKNAVIPREVMKIIALTIPYQKYLSSIIINSGLCMESLYEISKFLPKSNITEIVLDGTFLSQANYHILLTDSKLKHFSLAKCTINDAVVKMIADELKDTRPASRVLSALNLSSNRITDVGAKYLADMLRTNRKLCYLNLAGNMITDQGGLRIIDSLHEFPLEAQELLDSRDRYKKSKLTEAQIIQDKAAVLADRMLGLFIGPFSPNNTKTRDGVVYCFGNNTLCYLNIAYNNLSYVSLKKLHEVLSTQNSLNRTPRGLIKVVIEGNLMPVACQEFAGIDRILCGYKRQSLTVIKKKPVSSRSAK